MTAAASRVPEAVYVYEDEQGAPLFEVCRFPGKDFRQRRPDGAWGLGDARRVLYRLPRIRDHLAANSPEPIYIVEGEKDVHAVEAAGAVATCNPMGAGKWSDDYSDQLQGARAVVIVVDRDGDEKRGTSGLTPGEQHASRIVESLARVGLGEPHVTLVQAAAGKDAADHLDAGYTLGDFVPFPLSSLLQRGGDVVELPSRYQLTDLGNADRFRDLYKDHVRYCDPWSKWLVWDGKRWAVDDTVTVEEYAKATVRAVHDHAQQLPEGTTGRDALLKHAHASQRAPRIRAITELARSHPGIPIRPAALDANPYQLNVANGTLDLHTHTLRPQTREDLNTKLAPVDYDPAAQAPRWATFLDEVFAGDHDLVSFAQRAVGYSLTGDTSAQVFFLLDGPGQNGKSTYLEVLRDLLGDYAQQAPPDTFLERRYQGIPNDVARLQGARLVTAVETGENKRLDEALVKRMTGGDRITARFLRAEFFEFEPLFKVWLATNHLPVVKGTDLAIWRRIRRIPFHVTIPEADRDPDLKAKLRDELPGILNWALEGLRGYHYGDGLEPPEVVTAATAEYRTEQDTLGNFIGERCRLDVSARAKGSDLYRAYVEWCAENGERQDTQTRFGRALTDRGIDVLPSGGHRWRIGIELRTEQQSMDGEPDWARDDNKEEDSR